MIGTDLEIQAPDRTEIAGADAVRLPTLRTTADNDLDLVEVWLKSHADGSAHTLRAYRRVGTVFVEALGRAGSDLRRATIDHVLAAVGELRIKQDGSLASPATANMAIAAVKALLGFAT